ncbi:MAG: flippase [Patescibacteria group bacterium]|nr:flippase [Patescibacteria group bacterium]
MGKLKSFFLNNKTASQTVVKNTVWLISSEAVARTLRAAIIIYAARVLGTAGWGVFSYAITLAGFFTIFSDIGINAIINKETSRNPESGDKYISTSLFIKLALIIMSSVLIIFVAPLFTKIAAAKTLFPIITLVLAFDSLRDFGYSVNRAFEKMEREAIVKFTTNISIAGLGFIFLLSNPSPKSLTIAYAIGSGIGAIYILWLLRPHFKNLFKNFSPKLILSILGSAWPFALVGLMSGLMINTDTIMLGWWKTASDLGLYSAAQRPIQLLYVVPSLLSAATFPAFARLAKKDNNRFRIIFEKVLTVSILSAAPLTVGGVILGRQLIGLAFGASYLPASLAFQILCLTLFLTFPAIVITNGIFAYDEQKSFTAFIGLGAIGNVILNLLLIPTWGIEGSAIATVVAQFLAYGYAFFKMKKVNNFQVLTHVKRIAFATIVMCIISLAILHIHANVVINVVISGAAYFIILWLLKEPVMREVRSVFSVS